MSRNCKLIVNCRLCNDASVIHFDALKRRFTLAEGWTWYSEQPDKSKPTWSLIVECGRHTNTQSRKAEPCSKA